MPNRLRPSGLRKVIAAAVGTGLLLTGLTSTAHADTATPSTTEDPIVIRSFDGTPIVARMMLPTRATGTTKVPAILMTHGWGGSRPTGTADTLDDVIIRKLLDAGYGVLTWDSRGFGQSGGQASPAGPAEVADARALIDYLATRPEIIQDKAGDPRVGWTGGSNAAGIQFNTAAADRRIDAIAPFAGWGNLNQDLWPNGAVKTTWWNLLFGTGSSGSLTGGLISPAGVQLGALDPQANQAYAETTLTGEPSTTSRAWFDARSTVRHSGSITAPTLIVQGTIDTLFPLEDGLANYQNLLAAGTPVKFMAMCFGHTVIGCSYGPTGDDRDATTGQVLWQQRIIDWMDRYVKKDASVKTGPQVEWQANDGKYYAATKFPLTDTTTVTGLPMSTGLLAGPGGTGGDGPTNGAPAADTELGVTAARSTVLAPSSSPRAIFGVPSVRVSGTAVGLSAQIHMELIDRAPDGTRVTVDDQTMPWRFAGLIDQDIDLHAVAWRLEPGHALELEITTGSAQYEAPRTGPFTVDLKAVIKLPVTPMN